VSANDDPTRNKTNAPEGVDPSPEDYFTTEEYKKDVIQECMYALKLKIFGNDLTGKRAYINLRRYMRTACIDVKHGIRSWANRMAELQSYLPECLWERGAILGKAPHSFSETEMQEIMDSNLTLLQQAKLMDLGWDLVYAHPYDTTIDKLENL